VLCSQAIYKHQFNELKDLEVNLVSNCTHLRPMDLPAFVGAINDEVATGTPLIVLNNVVTLSTRFH
jgi:hypothetical protein